MQDLKITIVQSDLKWQDVQYNCNHFESIINEIISPTDVIVLPEMFNTAFSMQPEVLAELPNGRTVEWMIKLAKVKQAAICGSLMIKEHRTDGKPYFVNQFVWVTPNGEIERYNKHHLFNLIEENKHFEAGNKNIVFEYKGWKIQPFVCYDLRFPAWCRNKQNVDIQIFVANWPAKRSDHWKTLLKARAIENQCYVVGVNRIGNDNNEVYHSGDSGIYNFAGETLITIKDNAFVHTETLNYEVLKTHRKRYPFLEDKDEYTIE